MCEAQQIKAIKLINARMACLRDTAMPVYKCLQTVTVPTSHVEFVTDYLGQPLPENTPVIQTSPTSSGRGTCADEERPTAT
jgi:hypothetical protein